MNKNEYNKLINNIAFAIIKSLTYLNIALLFFLIIYTLYNSLIFKKKEKSDFLSESKYFLPLMSKENDLIDFVFLINKKIKVNQLTTKNIQDIYNRKISHWGKITDQVIDTIPYALDYDNKLTQTFNLNLLKSEKFKNSVKIVKDEESLMDAIALNSGAIGFISKDKFNDSFLKKKKLKAIKILPLSLMINKDTTKIKNNLFKNSFSEETIENFLNGNLTWQNLIKRDLNKIYIKYNLKKIESKTENSILQDNKDLKIIEAKNKSELLNIINKTEGSFTVVPWHEFNSENIISIEREKIESPLNFNFITSIPRDSGKVGGISYIIINTFLVILLTALISIIIGIATGIFIAEYESNKAFVKILSTSVEILSGIPAIIFGLFGLIFFVPKLGMGILSGAISSSLMILPIIIKTTEESIKGVPKSYMYASLALGANKTETILKVILPAASPGILTGIILAIGRALGETAVLLFTMGTNLDVAKSLKDPARSLTVHLLLLFQEGSIAKGFATASVLVLIILSINLLSKYAINKLYEVKYK